MIAFLRGAVLEKASDYLILEAAGVGYEVQMTPTRLSQMAEGQPLELFIAESVGMYGGGTTLYGFPTREEKKLFLCLKENVQNTGAKKALEYLDKAVKSLPDFRRAILERDVRMLSGVFGFSKRNSERLIDALKDKLGAVAFPGTERLPRSFAAGAQPEALSQVLNALTSLGYRASEARLALEAVRQDLEGRQAGVEEMIRMALKRLYVGVP